MYTLIVTYRLANDKTMVDIRYTCYDFEDAFGLIRTISEFSETEVVEYRIRNAEEEAKYSKGDNHNG